MANQGVNSSRRLFLTATTAVVGGAGAAVAAIPFLKTFKPSAKAEVAGAPVTQDISKLQPGQLLVLQWRGQPIWIVRRTPEMLEALPSLDGSLRDPKSENPEQQPDYARNEHRSLRPEVLVLVGTCTHLGCSPMFRPEMVAQPFDSDWKGGFYCPCHNSRFDLAGRVYVGVPAPTNLVVPPHRYLDDNRVQIGVNPEGGA